MITSLKSRVSAWILACVLVICCMIIAAPEAQASTTSDTALPQVIVTENKNNDYNIYFINSTTVWENYENYTDGKKIVGMYHKNQIANAVDIENMGWSCPWMNTYMRYATKVVIDDSFASVKPASCYGWFSKTYYVSEIEGLKNLDTSKCTNMNSMFYLSGLKTLDLSTFDTSQVSNATSMFNSTKLTELDLSGWDVSNLSAALGMFRGSGSLKTIYCDYTETDWSASSKLSGENATRLFEDCSSLVGTYGDTAVSYKWQNVDSDYAKSADLGGYFTPKGERECEHTWDNGKVTKKATLTSTGTMLYTCTKCGETKTETIAKVKLGTTKVSAIARSPKKMAVSWNKVSGASSYIVAYRIAGQKWTTKAVSGTSAVLSGMKTGKLYQYKVAAVKNATAKTAKVTGSYSAPAYRFYRSMKSLKAAGKKKSIKLTWKKTTGATGYVIQYSLKKNFSGRKQITINKANAKAYTIKNLKKGKTYYVRMRPVRKSGGKSYLGILSSIKKVKVK